MKGRDAEHAERRWGGRKAGGRNARPGTPAAERARVQKALDAIEELCVCLLAVAVARGEIAPGRAREHLQDDTIHRRVMAAATRIAGPTATPDANADDPLLRLGPGGDYRRDVGPADLGGQAR